MRWDDALAELEIVPEDLKAPAEPGRRAWRRIGDPAPAGDALYCRGLLDLDAQRLLAAAERYDDAGQPLLSAKALEAAAKRFADADDRSHALGAFTRAVEVYTSLGAAADVARLQATFLAHGIRRSPHAKARRVIDINAQLIAGAGHGSVTSRPWKSISESLI
jgi:hypothetical protein